MATFSTNSQNLFSLIIHFPREKWYIHDRLENVLLGKKDFVLSSNRMRIESSVRIHIQINQYGSLKVKLYRWRQQYAIKNRYRGKNSFW